jgi:polyisoprenoid-binding protein YceI
LRNANAHPGSQIYLTRIDFCPFSSVDRDNQIPAARPARLPRAARQRVDYQIDPTHTYANFEIDHMGFSTQRGLFRHTSGQISYDPEARSGTIEIRIDTASLDTGFGLRDEVLRGADWFNVQSFPDIIFRSQRFIFNEERPVAVEGKLIMLGEIRPLRLEISRFKCGLNLAVGKRGCGADAEGVLRRSEFGMQTGIPFIGDEVRLHVQVEAYPPR